MGIVTWIGTDGTEVLERPSKYPSRESLHHFIGDDIELVHVLSPTRQRAHMWVNGIGAIMEPPLKLNMIATGHYRRACQVRGEPNDEFIYGPAVLIEGWPA